MTTLDAYAQCTIVPRIAVRLPLVLPVPDGFEPGRPQTWPAVAGRLEYVEGRLVYMPPCGDRQQRTAGDVVTVLGLWSRQHPEFVVGANEAGMILGGDVRAADAAVWRRDDLGPETGGFPAVAPVLAVEIAGKDETAEDLADKARWYLERGVVVVWILDPSARSVTVVTARGTETVARTGRLAAHAALPGLEPALEELFRQIG